MTIETHPLEPFLPQDASILFLGSFPPPRARWSMDFFYPNFNNDFWRVMGLVHFGDAQHFVNPAGKRFDYEAVVDFCRAAGLAFFDTASQVRRLKDNASDAFLEVLQPTDVGALLARLPRCRTIVTTGGKASEELAALLRRNSASTVDSEFPNSPVIPGSTGNLPDTPVSIPAPGTSVDVSAWGRTLRWWRMPSTSRAYPLALTAKAAAYARLWP
ncbi:MAG: uracil-DNA glycosylase family protein [Bacteroidales bacterium]|nr:uracil-DNA glycosylase family protein [Bacteroidales bacterium]